MNITIDFDAIKEKVGTIAQAGVAQTKKVATIAKLKTDNMAQQDALRKAYLAIGKLCYAKYKDAPEEDLAPLFAKVDAALSAIAANNAALEELKAAEEVVIDVEMQAGEMPDEAEEPSVDDVMADVQETVAEATGESEPAEAPEAPAEPEAPADDENKAE